MESVIKKIIFIAMAALTIIGCSETSMEPLEDNSEKVIYNHNLVKALEIWWNDTTRTTNGFVELGSIKDTPNPSTQSYFIIKRCENTKDTTIYTLGFFGLGAGPSIKLNYSPKYYRGKVEFWGSYYEIDSTTNEPINWDKLFYASVSY